MPENLVQTKIRMVTEGSQEAVKSFADLNAEAEQAAANFRAAEDAAQGLNDTVANYTPIPFDSDVGISAAKNQFVTGIKETSKAVEKAAESTVDFGKASEMLFSSLDAAIPGLGGIAEAALSLNPAAILATGAVAGLALVFAEAQRQAEETRKAIEAQIQADVDRALAQSTLDQRTNLALAGNKEARQSIITDMAANAAEVKNIADQMAEVNTQLAFQQQELERSTKMGSEGFGLYNSAKASIATLEEQSKSLNAQLEANSDNFLQLEESAKKLDITQEELAAVNLAVAQGADGAAVALEKIWGAGEQFTKFGENVGSALEGIKKFGFDVIKYAEEIEKKKAEDAKKAADERAKSEEKLLQINEQLANIEGDRGRVLADRYIEEQRSAQIGALEEKLVAAQAYDAARAKNAKIAEIQQQGQADEINAQQKFMADQQKILSNYLKAEKEATEDYSRERVRKLEDLYNTLNNLASQRDVAGFVNARRSGMTDIGRGDEDAGISAQRRKAEYERAAQDQIVAANKERATRQAQLQQKLQQEQQAGQKEVSMASIVQKQIADLRAQYAAQDLRARRMQEDAAYRQTVSILQSKREAELKITAGAASGVISILSKMRDSITKFGSGLGQAGARGIPKFDTGTPMITRTGLAVVHQGEGILNAAENARYLRGGSRGGMGNLTLNLSVGQHVSQSELMAVKDEIVGAIVSYGANSNN